MCALTADALARASGQRSSDQGRPGCRCSLFAVRHHTHRFLHTLHAPPVHPPAPLPESLLEQLTDSLAPGLAIQPYKPPGMAKNRDERGTRYHEDDPLDGERERRHRRRKNRELAEDEAAAKRERRERRRADEARRQAEVDIDELRARRESYYTQPDSERRRTQDRMAQESRRERVKEAPRELRRDGTRRSKRREVVADDRSDDYVYGRPSPRVAAEQTTIRRSSTRKRSDEGNSSSRTAYTPLSGSGSASLRRGDAPKLSRSTSAREPSRGFMATRPTVRRTNTTKLPTSPPEMPRTQSTRDVARRSTGGIFANLFARPPRTLTTPVHKEAPMLVSSA